MNTLMDYAPTAGLLFFFCVFLWIAFQAYRPSHKRQLESHAFIPLKEESPNE